MMNNRKLIRMCAALLLVATPQKTAAVQLPAWVTKYTTFFQALVGGAVGAGIVVWASSKKTSKRVESQLAPIATQLSGDDFVSKKEFTDMHNAVCDHIGKVQEMVQEAEDKSRQQNETMIEIVNGMAVAFQHIDSLQQQQQKTSSILLRHTANIALLNAINNPARDAAYKEKRYADITAVAMGNDLTTEDILELTTRARAELQSPNQQENAALDTTAHSLVALIQKNKKENLTTKKSTLLKKSKSTTEPAASTSTANSAQPV